MMRSHTQTLSTVLSCRANSFVKNGLQALEIKTLPFGLCCHFWLFGNKNKGGEKKAPRGLTSDVDPSVTLWGGKEIIR